MDVITILKRLLNEETDGIHTFLNEIKSHYDISDELYSELLLFIEESDCKKIEFAKFNYPALGLALETGVMINSSVIGNNLSFLIFVILHEIAHQYQFKKYGDKIMYDCYIGDISEDEAAEFMKHTEEVADEFAIRKIRYLQEKGLVDLKYKPSSPYKNKSIDTMKTMVVQFRNQLKKENIKTTEGVSEYFYNLVKNKM
jgi:hypothetical protein